MPRRWKPRPEDRQPTTSAGPSTPSSERATDTSSAFVRRSPTPPERPSGSAGEGMSSSGKQRSISRSRSRIGGLVPLERAAGSPRLPALDTSAPRRNDIARRFRAVMSGRPLPAKAPSTPFGSPSKYDDTDED